MDNEQIIELIKNGEMSEFEKWIADKEKIALEKDLDLFKNKAIHIASEVGIKSK